MKRFLINTIYFSIIFLVINVVMFYAVVKPALFEKYIVNTENISNYNYLLLSDSHGAYLNSSINENGIFNASYFSDNYHDILLKIKYFTKKMPEGATVFLSIDNHQFSEYRDGEGNIENTNIYAENFESVKGLYSQKEFYINKYTSWMPILNPKFTTIIQDYIRNRINQKTQLVSIKDISKENLNRAALDRIEYQFQKSEKSQQQLSDLHKIIEFCAVNNIRLVCVKFPVTKEYWNLVKHYDYGMIEILENNDIEVLDLHDLFFDKNYYFRDQDHMNFDGGIEFSKLLIEKTN